MSIIDTLYDRHQLLLKQWNGRVEYARDALYQTRNTLYAPMTRVFWRSEYNRTVKGLWAMRREIHQARAELRESLKPYGNPVWDHDRELAVESYADEQELAT